MQLFPKYIHPEFRLKFLKEITDSKPSLSTVRRWEKATGIKVTELEVDIFEQFKQMMKSSRHTVIFTGAGMATESGVPDFRSAQNGMWNGIDPLSLASVDAMKHNRTSFMKFYRKRILDLQDVQFNKGHEILAQWEKVGLIKSIITQNVDGLHAAAGSQNVFELHGSLSRAHCNDCLTEYEIEKFLNEETCRCGGIIRPGVVLFGENLPEKTLKFASIESEKADLFIVLGSSLSVSPANWFPVDAKENGAKLVIVNNDPTDLDDVADLVINDYGIGEVLARVKRLLEVK
ncbi:hypothetical protein CIB95_13030 [Lottiidibacillus patelloidae]|uniref:protein acetyllysine N-acetyltransferase n=2 Tax=Lottiidibacillus patelloidae TaxID=2670334 RepID=A0A263BRM1_9BACI|nr:hypothetical protein CIB95_13030 [Lottiidibacillus patelloidae]